MIKIVYLLIWYEDDYMIKKIYEGNLNVEWSCEVHPVHGKITNVIIYIEN